MALSFAEVWKSKDTDFEEAYYEFCIWANLRRKVEYKSAVLIQRTWRKHALKKWLDFLSQQAIQIQKVIRGYLARKHLRNQLEGEWHDALNKYYHFNATQIQRRWRGYWSRKIHLNFSKRKEYLKFVAEKSNEVRRQLELFEKQQRHRHRALVHQQVEKDHQYITHRFHHMLSTSHVQGAYHRPLSSLAKTTHSTPSPTPTTLTKWKKSTAFLKKKTPEHVAFYVHRPLSPSTPLKRPKLYSPRHLHSSSSSSFPCKHTHILPFGKFSDSVGYLNQSDVMIHDSTILQSHPRTSHSINAHVAWVLQQAELRLHLPPSSRPTSSHPTSQGSWPPSSSFKFTHHKDDRGRSTSPSFTNAPLHPVQPILLHPLVKKKPNLSDPLKQNPSKILHLDPLNPKHMQHVPERWKKRVSPKPSSTT